MSQILSSRNTFVDSKGYRIFKLFYKTVLFIFVSLSHLRCCIGRKNKLLRFI